MSTKDTLLAEFDHEIATTRRLLERLPDDKLDWRPHDRSRSLGGLATHLATLPLWGGTILNEPSFDLTGASPNVEEKTSRVDILDAFDGAVKRVRGWMDKSDAEYAAPWMLKRQGHEMFTVPRVAAFRSFVIHHLVHHRGQLSVYLRLNEIPLPPMYGPTADEGL
jgi:uncharacterized damage-inducible protein DinB